MYISMYVCTYTCTVSIGALHIIIIPQGIKDGWRVVCNVVIASPPPVPVVATEWLHVQFRVVFLDQHKHLISVNVLHIITIPQGYLGWLKSCLRSCYCISIICCGCRDRVIIRTVPSGLSWSTQTLAELGSFEDNSHEAQALPQPSALNGDVASPTSPRYGQTGLNYGPYLPSR